ncbi:MAG TPA: response regulator [Pirellulales bacterium]|nr:response regulator [Pirellulales bacterium]
MLARRTVLVVDPLDETHEVLRAALGEQGVDVLASHDSARGLALAKQHRPHLIVLDLEADSSSSALAGRLASEASETPLVVLGTAKRATFGSDACQFLRKPYHYAPLIRKIEELLAA